MGAVTVVDVAVMRSGELHSQTVVTATCQGMSVAVDLTAVGIDTAYADLGGSATGGAVGSGLIGFFNDALLTHDLGLTGIAEGVVGSVGFVPSFQIQMGLTAGGGSGFFCPESGGRTGAQKTENQ